MLKLTFFLARKDVYLWFVLLVLSPSLIIYFLIWYCFSNNLFALKCLYIYTCMCNVAVRVNDCFLGCITFALASVCAFLCLCTRNLIKERMYEFVYECAAWLRCTRAWSKIANESVHVMNRLEFDFDSRKAKSKWPYLQSGRRRHATFMNIINRQPSSRSRRSSRQTLAADRNFIDNAIDITKQMAICCTIKLGSEDSNWRTDYRTKCLGP